MRIFITVIGVLCCTFIFAQQQGKKVQFTGGARSLMTHSDFESEDDTVTAPKTFGGYALVDLGVQINPNKHTEVMGMFRINSALGGFWGSAVSFDVRQLYVKGVAANVVRYQVGTIDYKLTPYTFFNHNPDMLLPATGAMRVKQEVVDYETFYAGDNTWRQQGATAGFALQFPKGIEEIEFNGFMLRLNPSYINNLFERLYGGGNVVLKQGKYFDLGFNHASIFDLPGTSVSTDVYSNNVSTFTYDLHYEQESFRAGLDGESGMSSSRSKDSLSLTPTLNDYFVHARAYFNLKKTNLGFDVGYMDNGPDFRSFGAQSKRVNFDGQNNFYERYTNNQMVRPVSYFDLYNDPLLYNRNITDGVMAYDPVVNNVLPYGIATFNRRGVYAGLSYADSARIIDADMKFYRLQEIRGQGTTLRKNFNFLKTNLKFSLSNLIQSKRNYSLQLGLAYQNTQRKSAVTYEAIALNSMALNAGLELEVVPQLTLLLNYFALQAKGNELMPQRNAQAEIINYNPFTVDGSEWNIAGGLRFNFTQKIYLAGLYEWNKNDFVVGNPYRYSLFSVYYIMQF